MFLNGFWMHNMYKKFSRIILSRAILLLFCLTFTDFSGHDNDTEPLTGCPRLSHHPDMSISTSINALHTYGSYAVVCKRAVRACSFSPHQHNMCSMTQSRWEMPHSPAIFFIHLSVVLTHQTSIMYFEFACCELDVTQKLVQPTLGSASYDQSELLAACLAAVCRIIYATSIRAFVSAVWASHISPSDLASRGRRFKASLCVVLQREVILTYTASFCVLQMRSCRVQ